MKKSIKRQFAGIFIGLMALSIFTCWFINKTFLQEYYEKNRETAIEEAYTTLNTAGSNGTLYEDPFSIELEKISGRYNIAGIVLNENGEIVIAFGNDIDMLMRQIWERIYGVTTSKEQVPTLLERTDDYLIQKVLEARTNTEYIEMYGVLSTGETFFMRTALENIRESADLANRFLIYVGIVCIGISGLIIWFVTKKITEPIMQLAKISERMIHLDFDAKYTGKNRNEIALLGDNINQLSETLEQTISELKTANNELQNDIQKKIEIDEMRKEFLSNVSHELKTPIALIQGYAEGLKEGINDDVESREFYCEVIMDEAAKMNTMVKKLLTLNQLEAGNDNISLERFDMVALIYNYLQSAQILLKQNDILVRMKHYEPCYVWADEFKVEEVIMNYITNAVNHANQDKIIDVKLEERGHKVRVSVFNTGEPIPEDSLPHIWEKFYKVDKARTREYGGSGVGLSIVKAIMESLNQEYGVNNYENGVEFWFQLETVESEPMAEV